MPDTVIYVDDEVIETVWLEWEEVAVGITYEDIFEAESAGSGEANQKWSKTAAAEFFIRGFYAGSPTHGGMASDIIREASAQVGCVPRTVSRAADELTEGGHMERHEETRL